MKSLLPPHANFPHTHLVAPTQLEDFEVVILIEPVVYTSMYASVLYYFKTARFQDITAVLITG